MTGRAMDPDTLTYDEWDALLIEEWFQADSGAPLPASSREGEFEFAHQNRAAWVLVDEPELNGLSKVDAQQLMLRASRGERKFDPALHPHDPHSGEFVDTPGGGIASVAKDLLDLAGRIDLDSREQLVSSGRLVGDNGGDVHLNWAVVRSPAGNEVRIGVIPHHDSDKWRAADLGGTAVLDVEQVRKLRTDFSGAAAEARKVIKEADALYGAGDVVIPAHPTPHEKIIFGMAPVAQGVLPNDWADLHWSVHLTDDESAPWQLVIEAGDPETNQADGVVFEPKTFVKLLKHLDGIESELVD